MVTERPPVVGVTLCLDPGKRWRPGRDYVYLHRAYLARLRAAGAAPIAIGPDLAVADCMRLCDGIVISGGGDLPASFAPADLDVSSLPDHEEPERIDWERQLLDACREQRRPVLGICYGMQLACIHFGGRLEVDLETRGDRSVPHGQSDAPTRHTVTQVGPSELLAGLGSSFETSSAHRQGVASLPAAFSPVAHSNDGLVEAFEAVEDHWLMGLQWHPEIDATAAPVYGNFVRKAARRS